MKLSKIAKKLIMWIGVIALVCVLISIIYYRSWGFLPFLYGALVGTVASVLRVMLLDRAVNQAVTMDKKKAGGYITMQNLLRFVVSGAALLLGALWEPISLWGVVAGVLAFQFALYCLKHDYAEETAAVQQAKVQAHGKNSDPAQPEER